MMLLAAAVNFIVGFLVGASLMFLGFLYLGRAVLKKQINRVISSAKGMAKNSANAEGDALMDKVRELTLEQLDLRGQLDQPQKNALHGKHKNGISARIKDLEEEKLALLRQALASGYDPEIGTIDENGEIKRVRLSAYMAEYDSLDKEAESNTKPAEKSVKKENPFKVIEGGKSSEGAQDDNDSNR